VGVPEEVRPVGDLPEHLERLFLEPLGIEGTGAPAEVGVGTHEVARVGLGIRA